MSENYRNLLWINFGIAGYPLNKCYFVLIGMEIFWSLHLNLIISYRDLIAIPIVLHVRYLSLFPLISLRKIELCSPIQHYYTLGGLGGCILIAWHRTTAEMPEDPFLGSSPM